MRYKIYREFTYFDDGKKILRGFKIGIISGNHFITDIITLDEIRQSRLSFLGYTREIRKYLLNKFKAFLNEKNKTI